MVTDVMKWHWGPPALKCQVRDYQNKDRLSVCRILSLQRIPKLGRGLDIAGLDFGSQSCQYCWFLAKSVLFHSAFPHYCYSWISCCASIIRWEPGFLVAFSDIFQNFLGRVVLQGTCKCICFVLFLFAASRQGLSACLKSLYLSFILSNKVPLWGLLSSFQQ